MDYDIYVTTARQDADDKTISQKPLNLAGKKAIKRASAYGEGEFVKQPNCLKRKFKELCEQQKITIFHISWINGTRRKIVNSVINDRFYARPNCVRNSLLRRPEVAA